MSTTGETRTADEAQTDNAYGWRDPNTGEAETAPAGEGEERSESGPRRGRGRRRGRGGERANAAVMDGSASVLDEDKGAYAWQEDSGGPPPPPANDAPMAEAATAQAVADPTAGQTEGPDDAAPIAPAPAKRPRRSAAKAKAAEPVEGEATAIAAVIDATAPIAPAEPAEILAPEESPPSEPANQPAPQRVPDVAAEPDPNEISTAPATPRRGWWRR